jgi:tocopherol O-methyltransferase
VALSIKALFGGLWRLVTGRFLPRSDAELKSGIAKFYDESSQIWLDVWGEHMHHGYYPTPSYKEHQAAQIDMIDRTLTWAYQNNDASAAFTRPKTMVDVGCGVGGSSRHIARKWGLSTAKGVSLSPFQIQKATEFTKQQGLDGTCSYAVEDAMRMASAADGAYDLVWSMESGEHMPDKAAFVNELFRVTAPGGRVIIVTWCHRELLPGETGLRPDEEGLLARICDAYYLPAWCPASEYVRLAEGLGLEDVRQADWSEPIAPFWGAVFWSALGGPFPKNLLRLLRSGPTTVKGAIATLWMLRGFQRGVIKFALITGKKKEA